MSNRVFSMAAQLKKGKAAEKAFLERYGSDAIERLSGRKGDFQIKWSRAILELKTDFYENSPNLFIERWSVVGSPDREAKPGGPWQSVTHNASYYVYWFVSTDELFVFNAAALASFLEPQLASFRRIQVRNKGYTTEGYLVPKKLFTESPKENLVSAEKEADVYLGNSLDAILFFDPSK